MMKLLYLVVSLFFLGASSSIETEILEYQPVESRAAGGYTLEFEYEQQTSFGKNGPVEGKRGLSFLPLSIKGSIEFYNDDYFFTPNNYKSIQFDLVYTSNYAIDEHYNKQSELNPKRDVANQRVKVLKNFHSTEEDLTFAFEYRERREKFLNLFKKLDYSKELVGQIISEDEGEYERFGASEDLTFVIQSLKYPKRDFYVETPMVNTLLVIPLKKGYPQRDSIFNDTNFDFRNSLPENDPEFIDELLRTTSFVLKSVKKVDAVYSPYGNSKSKYQFDLKFKTQIFGGNDNQKLIQNIENSPTQTEVSRFLLNSLRGSPSEDTFPIELRGRIGFSKFDFISIRRQDLVLVDDQYLDYMKMELVFTGGMGLDETVLYTFGLSSTEITFGFEEGIDITKEFFGQKTKSGDKFEDLALFNIFSVADIIFIPTNSLTQRVIMKNFGNEQTQAARQPLLFEQIITLIQITTSLQFDLISIKPVCVPKKINTKLTKFGEYQDCLFPQNKKMECYSFKALFPSGTEPTSCVVEECSSVDSAAFNRKCNSVSGVKNICKIDSAKKQVCVKREACTGARKGDSCARVYQFLGENKKDTCKAEALPLASIVAPFNDGSMKFKSNKYCH